MPPAQSGKERASRIPLDYFKQPDAVARWKGRLSLAACVLVLGALALGRDWLGTFGLRENAQGRAWASRGPLANVHAAWDTRCEACHVDFRPIASSDWTPLIGAAPRAGDTQCANCHNPPTHHPNERPEQVAACADCHKDHQGRDTRLSQVANAACAGCHADLEAHRRADAPKTDGFPARAKITQFDRDHPEFAALTRADAGKIKFNHMLHLTPGITANPGGKPLTTLGAINAADRERYRAANQSDADGVQLNCASCHQFAASPDSRGAYSAPISFASHCAACHRMEVPGPSNDVLAIDHGKQPAEVRKNIETLLFQALVKSEPIPPTASRERPDIHARRNLEKQWLAQAAENAKLVERLLFQGEKALCTECHYYQTVAGESVAEPTPADLTAIDRLLIEPARIPTTWLQSARFNHKPHSAVDCRACHEPAFADAPNPSVLQKNVMIPSIQICRDCHAPQSTVAGTPRGGVAFDCITCHRYHGAREGGSTSSPAPPRSVDAFLEGATQPASRTDRGTRNQ
jgi:predicted CXXCH cytochrome family protein